MGFVDTNILLHATSRDPSDAVKRAIALVLLDRHDLGLSVQVLQEFYVQATRPTRRYRLADGDARNLVLSWTRTQVQDNTAGIMLSALDIQARHRLSYWDSAIIAAAAALGCDTLLTEDLSHGQVVAGVTITNPFL